jgi:hypothetical protein
MFLIYLDAAVHLCRFTVEVVLRERKESTSLKLRSIIRVEGDIGPNLLESSKLFLAMLFFLGLCYLSYMLLIIIDQLSCLIWPFAFTSISVLVETIIPRGWNASESCPQLWRDGLEDML